MNIVKSFPIIVASIFILGGCTTIESIYDKDTTENTIKNIYPDDTLYIKTVKDIEYKIKVKSVNDKYITGQKIKIPIAQIKVIEKETVSSEETIYVGFGLMLSIGITVVMVQLGII